MVLLANLLVALTHHVNLCTDPLVSHGFGLTDAERALTVGAHDPTAVKTVVNPQR